MEQNISNEFMNLINKGKFWAENMQACGTIAPLFNAAVFFLKTKYNYRLEDLGRLEFFNL